MRLPIDDHLDDCAAILRDRNLVLVAEPGAGKTTRLPPRLLEGPHGPRRVVVLEPRRLAARLAATHVARELGGEVGGLCGYEVRFDRRVSERTRLRYMTEGMFIRGLTAGADAPMEADVVVFDEFHERHLDGDHALARLLLLQQTTAPDLRLVAMSATLDPEPLRARMNAAVRHVSGRVYPVDVDYVPDRDRPLDRQVLRSLQRLVEEGLDGHVLVFLPGMRAIEDARTRCAAFCEHHGIAIHRLHGDLDLREQQRAIAPGEGRRVILSTNIAESSVTIDGVVAVIDAGLANVARRHPWSGALELRQEEISRASADQRAGRAGRTRAGRCLRLYGRDNLARRAAADTPEIERADLSRLVLDLAAAELDADALPWLDAPPAASLSAARGLLDDLGATRDRRITELGAFMQRLPVHPRHGRVLAAARDLGVGRLAARAVATLQEGLRARPRDRGGRCDALECFETLTRERGGIGLGHARRVAQQLAPRNGRDHLRGDDAELALSEAFMAGFGDRLAAVVDDGPGQRRAQFAGGGFAEVPPHSVAYRARFCVVADVSRRATGTRRRLIVESATVVDPATILEQRLEHVEERVRTTYDDAADRVIARRELCIESVVVESEPFTPDIASVGEALRAAAIKKGHEHYDPQGRLIALATRLELANDYGAELPPLDAHAVSSTLLDACACVTSLAALRKMDLTPLALGRLGVDPGWIDRELPSHVNLAGGRRLEVQYSSAAPPHVASWLQDFFGSAHGPTLLSGRLPLVLHLLAPNRRPVQVTTDLQSFWDVHYPALRRQLMRRYPRHDWPEDPVNATPPPPRGRRRRR